MTSKQCGGCNRELGLSEFNRRGDGLQGWCRDCNRERSKAYYARNRNKHKTDAYERKIKNVSTNRDKFQAIKSKCKCALCPEATAICLDFHHVKDKEDQILRMIGRGRTWSDVIKEMMKCVVLCSNCHRKHHAGMVELNETMMFQMPL